MRNRKIGTILQATYKLRVYLTQLPLSIRAISLQTIQTSVFNFESTYVL